MSKSMSKSKSKSKSMSKSMIKIKSMSMSMIKIKSRGGAANRSNGRDYLSTIPLLHFTNS